MDIFTDTGELSTHIWRIKRNHSLKLWNENRAKPPYTEIVGFIPTMGALHEGHISLVKKSVADNPFTVASIFVNPLQFCPNEDLEKYPRSLVNDAEVLSQAGADALFHPDATTFYPSDFLTRVHVSRVTDMYCGASRPGHFEGVTTVVAKLFGVVQPDVAYFGEKDYQQLVIIRRMVADLNMQIRVAGMPTVREGDGLALSSRNRYLSAEERAAAPGLYAALLEMRRQFDDGVNDAHRLVQIGMAEMMKRMGLIDGFKIDYLEIADPDTLVKRETAIFEGDRALAAIRLGTTRLIDNIGLWRERKVN